MGNKNASINVTTKPQNNNTTCVPREYLTRIKPPSSGPLRVFVQSKVPSAIENIKTDEPLELECLADKNITDVHVSLLGCFFYSTITNELYYSPGDVPPEEKKIRRYEYDDENGKIFIQQISAQRSVLILFNDGRVAYLNKQEISNEIAQTFLGSEEDRFNIVCMGYCQGFVVCAKTGEVYKSSTHGNISPLGFNDVRESTDNVIKLAAGYDHVLALTKCGRVYAQGYGYHGELANGVAIMSNTAIPVNFFNNSTPRIKLRDVAAGYFHSLFLPELEPDTVYAVGRNAEGQLNLGSGFKNNSLEVVKINVRNVRTINANAYTSFFETDDVPLLYCGYCQVKERKSVNEITDLFESIRNAKSFQNIYTGLLNRTMRIIHYDFGVESCTYGVMIFRSASMPFKRLTTHLHNPIYADIFFY
jgi:hypothetical protein